VASTPRKYYQSKRLCKPSIRSSSLFARSEDLFASRQQSLVSLARLEVHHLQLAYHGDTPETSCHFRITSEVLSWARQILTSAHLSSNLQVLCSRAFVSWPACSYLTVDRPRPEPCRLRSLPQSIRCTLKSQGPTTTTTTDLPEHRPSLPTIYAFRPIPHTATMCHTSTPVPQGNALSDAMFSLRACQPHRVSIWPIARHGQCSGLCDCSLPIDLHARPAELHVFLIHCP